MPARLMLKPEFSEYGTGVSAPRQRPQSVRRTSVMCLSRGLPRGARGGGSAAGGPPPAPTHPTPPTHHPPPPPPPARENEEAPATVTQKSTGVNPRPMT